jgi:hypothetical protein
MNGPILPGEDLRQIRLYPQKPTLATLPMSRLTFNQSYDSEGLEPQQIREDFADLILMSDAQEILLSLSTYLPADDLAAFMDDRMMGRV